MCSRSSQKTISVKMVLPRVTNFLLVFAYVKCSIVNGVTEVEDSFKQCLVSQPVGSLGYCIGVGAISKLQSWDNNPEFDLVDGLTLSRDEQQYREGYNFMDSNPNDLR